MKTLSKIAAVLALAVAALIAVPAEKAKAQVWNNADTIQLQVNLVGTQSASAVAATHSYTSNATSDAVAANIGNMGDVVSTIDATAYQLNAYGSIAGEANIIVGQLNLVGSQSAAANANAVAQVVATSTAAAINVGNMSGVTTTVNALSSRH